MNHEKMDARIVKYRSCAVWLRCTLRCVFQTPKSNRASNKQLNFTRANYCKCANTTTEDGAA